MKSQGHWILAVWFCSLAQAFGEPLTLDQAVGQAVKSHPQVLAAQSRLRGARLRMNLAGAPLNPTAQIGETLGDPIEEVLNITQQFELAGQPALRGQVALQEARFRAYDMLLIERDIALQTGRYYLGLWTAGQRQQVYIERLRLYERLDLISTRRFQVGDIPENQLARVRVETQRARADLMGAAAEFAQAEARLRTSLGISAQTGLTIPAGVLPYSGPESTQVDIDKVRSAALQLPEVGEADANLQAARLRTELARKQGSPALGFVLYRGSFYRSDAAQGLQVNLSWTPWDYGQIEAEVVGREGEAKALESEVEAVKRNAQLRLETAFQSWLGAINRSVLLQSQLTETLRLAETAQKGFQSGYLALQDTLDAQRSFRDTQLEYLAAQSDLGSLGLELSWLLRPNQIQPLLTPEQEARDNSTSSPAPSSKKEHQP